VTWGPWQADVLLRSMSARLATDANPGERVPVLQLGNIDGTWLICAPAGKEAAAAEDQNVTINAYPAAGESCTHTQDGTAVLGNPHLAISIPYNLIVPQRHTVTLTIDQGQPGDLVQNLFLCLEYSREAFVAKGKPKAAKNNP